MTLFCLNDTFVIGLSEPIWKLVLDSGTSSYVSGWPLLCAFLTWPSDGGFIGSIWRRC